MNQPLSQRSQERVAALLELAVDRLADVDMGTSNLSGIAARDARRMCWPERRSPPKFEGQPLSQHFRWTIREPIETPLSGARNPISRPSVGVGGATRPEEMRAGRTRALCFDIFIWRRQTWLRSMSSAGCGRK
jgi:hypothetical protein